MYIYINNYIYNILLICIFCIFKIAYSLKFIYNPKFNVCGALTIIHGHLQKRKTFGLPDAHIPS